MVSSSQGESRWHGRSDPDGAADGPPMVRGFRWSWGGERHRLRLTIPLWLLQYYRSRPRGSQYGVYVVDPFDRDLLGGIAAHVDRFASRNDLDDRQRADFAASLVQQLEYVRDDYSAPTDRYPRYPVETLVNRGGDCKDSSILVAALLGALGYDVVFLRQPRHLQVGVALEDEYPGTYYEYAGDRYYVLETTNPSWTVGDLPSEYEDESVRFEQATGVPVVVHRWTALSGDQPGRVGGTFHVTNLGDGVANRVDAYVRFETETGRTVGRRDHHFCDISPGETRSWDFECALSGDTPVRGSVSLSLDSLPHDESASAYLRPESAQKS